MAGVKKNSKNNSAKSLPKKTLVKLLIVIGTLLIVGSIVAWLVLVRNNPNQVFNEMLENNFRTASVTRTVDQDNGYQKLHQVMRIQNRTEHITHGITVLTQGIGGRTVVVTESIGTPTVDYVKYNSITTTQKSQKGKSLNFDGVTNVWSINKVNSDEQLGNLYQDVTLGNLFLFADLSQANRNSMMNLINDQKVYTVDYGNVKKSWVDGRLKYTYKVAISPAAYIAMIKQYGQYIGLTQLEKLNPDSYKNAAPVKFEVVVDVLSQHPDSVVMQSSSSRQTFNGFGIIENIEIPENTIPASELQERLNQSASA